MKQYYISNSGKEEGPFSLKELENQKITNDTLVWYDGLEDWKSASELEDLNDLLKPKPKAEEPKTKPVTRKKTIPKRKKTVTRTNVPKASPPRMFSNVFGLRGRIRRLEYGLSYLAYYFIYFIYIQNIESTFLALVFLFSATIDILLYINNINYILLIIENKCFN